MNFYGNTGIIIEINLTKNEIKKLDVNENNYRKYLGGSGLAAFLFYHRLTKELHPLSAENPLGIFTGPLVGTRVPNCGRHVICAKSPATNIWGEANSGGKFGAFLKFLGLDGIIITGKSDNPTYLFIGPGGKVEFYNAEKLWGLDNFAIKCQLEKELGEISSYASIGIAGERLVKYAAVMNDGDRAAGRTGMGAVFGSKNLKAIALFSETRNVPVAFPEGLSEQAAKMRKYIKEISHARTLFGTAAYVSGGMKWGDVPVKYWYKGYMPNTEVIDGAKMKDTILTKRYHCYGCIIGCGRVVKINEGKYSIPETGGPEYETLAGFGTNLLVENLEGISYANYLCNVFGLDTISASQVIALVYHLYEKGILSEKELGEIKPIWGEIDSAIELLRIIVERKGIGNSLAEGIDFVVNEFNVPEEAHSVNGLELPYHDPRSFFSMAAVYATSSRGACHNNGDGYKMSLGLTVPEIALECKNRFDDKEAGKVAVTVQDYRSVYNGLIMCHFATPTFTDIAKALQLATSWDYSIEELITTGERITNLKRLLNRNLGLTKENDKLPKIMSYKLSEGGTEGNIPNLKIQLEEYYEKRGWDQQTGFPTEETKKRLDLLIL